MMQQQWELLITDGHAWASRWRRVVPFLMAAALTCGAGGFFLLAKAPRLVVAEPAVDAGIGPAMAAAWRDWLESAQPRDSVPVDSLPPKSELPELEKTIENDLDAANRVSTVGVEIVAIADLFSPKPGLRQAMVGDELAVFTALVVDNGYVARWTAAARRFDGGWKIANLRAPEDFPATLKTILEAAGKGMK